MARRKAKPWSDYFPRVTNGEWRALYSAGLSSPVQFEIVLYLLTQTRGTGKMMTRELDGHDDWAEARETYGREAAPLFRGQIAAAIGRDRRTVIRELLRLIDRGIVVEHESGHKGKPAVLSVHLFGDRPVTESEDAVTVCGDRPVTESEDAVTVFGDRPVTESEDAVTDLSPKEAYSVTDLSPKEAYSVTDSSPMLREIETLKNETLKNETAEPRRAKRSAQPAMVPPAAELTELGRLAARTLKPFTAE